MTEFRFAADENLHALIVRALRRRFPALDLVTVQEAGLTGLDDARVLDWVASENRILLTHDVRTMVRHATDRTRSRQPMPGLFEVLREGSPSQVLEDLALVIECSTPEEWAGKVVYIPL